MTEKKEKMIINGNEFYEIDLDCIRRKQEGKDCIKSQTAERREQKYTDKIRNK